MKTYFFSIFQNIWNTEQLENWNLISGNKDLHLFFFSIRFILIYTVAFLLLNLYLEIALEQLENWNIVSGNQNNWITGILLLENRTSGKLEYFYLYVFFDVQKQRWNN